MGDRAFKKRIYPEFARVAQALASDRRLELLDLLAQGPRHVEALAEETEMSVANVSQHLQVLRAAHLVEADRAGNRVVYCLSGPDVLRLWLLRGVAERRLPEVAEIRKSFAVPGAEGEEMSRGRLAKELAAERLVLLDVRPTLEFEAGHIPGAISIPPEDLESRLEELPRDRPVIAYCRGAYCLFADEAVALLREHGFEAYRLEGGWPEWALAEFSGM
jgi:rhodanese-related sulfurtransferase/DNA-binding transcriptional ArsR family regulator